MGGKLSIIQPGSGFRAGLDSVLLGASIPQEARNLLDLGAGVGVAGLTALTHDPALEAVFAEIDPQTADLARGNIAENGFAYRATVLTLDVLAPGNTRKAAGLGSDLFDAVIANPPYFAAGTLAPDRTRAQARHMESDALDGWVRTAVSSAHAQGSVIFIHAAEALPQLLAAFDARMGNIMVLPLCPRPGMAASRVLVRGQKGSRAPLTLLPQMSLHDADGHGFSPRFNAIFRGTARLDWHMARQDPTSGRTDSV
ncbi:tRNA1(Val) (adenine(37)-N6)-methyltransferase [Pelagibacterium sediminicola]|uniref:tRNA1(Val) (adenine(37)-N6)-methyltransferase n=1 Tax=Pelagibacterium sediminicola TaxID=2248761 RepID=UPI0013009A61|nr:methyltransferase [Pelagibacterium sediminicola]